MRMAKYVLISLFLAGSACAQQAARTASSSSATARELTAMLNQFMKDASANNAAGFNRFFADDLMYTGSNSMLHTKADIMGSLNTAKPASASADKQIYSAENIVVRDFGDTAIVAFQLMARTQHADGKTEISNYRDTGTFLRRGGRWQVIAWQATKVPDAKATK